MIFHRSAPLSLGLAVAAGLAAWAAWSSRSGTPSADGAVTASRSTIALPAGTAAASAGWAGPARHEREGHTPTSDGVRPPAPLARMAGAGRADELPVMESVWSHYQPTREELEYRAHRAEQQAAHELRSLLGVLELDDDQQDRVFAALVRRADYFHPALQVQRADGSLIEPRPDAAPASGGSAAVTPSETPGLDGAGALMADAGGGPAAGADPVMAELTPALADVYERYTSEREAFWVGIVEDIEAELNAP